MKNKIVDTYWACRRFIRDYIFEPVWYRFFGHKHHIVKTGLPPSPWYDTDMRMLYAVMSLVEWYVEKDMVAWSKKNRETELARIRKDVKNKEYSEQQIECLKGQWDAEDGIMEIYKWWKNYPKREKEIDRSLDRWHNYALRFSKDKNDVMGFLNRVMNKEQKEEEDRLLKIHRDLEDKLLKEEQEMLRKAVDLRGSMWS